METCIFCDVWGSAAYHAERDLPLEEQIERNREKIRRRYRANRFLVYLQSYTNTFTKADVLRSRIETILKSENVSGLVIGTRPDCISLGTLRILEEFAKKTYIHVEIGAQSYDDRQLSYMKRGHDSASISKAVRKLGGIEGLDVGIHLIFGWPGETREDIINAARVTNRLAVSSVKLHNLHVLKNTTLYEYYSDGKFTPLSLEEYADAVILFLERLNPDIALNRLTAVANRWDELVAPAWTKEKMRPMQYIINTMIERNAFQGRLYG